MSMRIKTTIVIILIVFVITAANYISSLFFTTKNMVATMETDQMLLRDIADNLIGTKIELMKMRAEETAKRLLGAQSENEWPDILKAQLDEFPDFMAFAVFSREGVKAGFGDSPAHDDTDVNSYLSSAFDKTIEISTSRIDPLTGKLVFYMYMPITSDMVLAVTIPGMYFSNILSEYKLWETGSIYLIDGEGALIAHYDDDRITNRINFIELAKTDPDLQSAGAFFEKMISDAEYAGNTGRYVLDGKERLCSYKHISNPAVDWVIAVVTPLSESPKSNVKEGLLYSALAFLAAGIIIAILVSRIAAQPYYKIEAQNRNLEKLNEAVRAQAAQTKAWHTRAKLLLDATPLACILWSRDYKVIDCNEECLKLYKMKDCEEVTTRLFDLIPEYQSDGGKSQNRVLEMFEKAFSEGSCTSEWDLRLLDGTPLPVELTFVRLEYENEPVVAGYARDLREYKQMMNGIERRGALLNTVNKTAAILLSMENDNDNDNDKFVDSLISGMELVGLNMDADRVQIWQNETIEDELNFVLKYEWLSDYARRKTPIPIGLKFSYSSKPGWKDMFLRGECINSPLSELSPGDQEFLSYYDIKSIVIIPLFLQDQFWGFFSIDDCRRERALTEEEIDILQSASLMLASAVNRNMQAARVRTANEQMKTLLDAMPFACSLWNKDNNLFECTEETVRLLELGDKQEFLDRFFDFSPEYQPDGVLSTEKSSYFLKKAFEKGGRITTEWLHRTSGGTLIPAEVTLVRIPYDGDYAVATYVRDLREHKKMMGEIERRDNLLNTVNLAANVLLQSESSEFENVLRRCMGMIGMAVDADRVCIWKNHVVDGRLRCYPIYEWLGNADPQIRDGITIDTSYDEDMPGWEETLSQGKCINRTLSDISRKERQGLSLLGALSIFAVPVFVRDQFWGMVGFDNCHSEKVFSENEASVLRSGGALIANALLRNEMTLNLQTSAARLEIALNDARDANAAKSNFLARMSHEIRTPLNVVIGLSELTLESGGLSDEVHANLEKINNSGTMLLSIVNDILDISKIEAGKLELLPVEYDIPSLINDTVTQSIMRMDSKPISFVLNIDENLPTRLYGDDLRIKQIINNLLSNAFKYTREGTVEFCLKCEREGDTDTVWMTILVRDTGIGIRPEDMNRLFGNYAQIDARINRAIDGTGLGLSITKMLAEMMGGSVTLESEYGRGSTFTAKFQQHFIDDTVIGPEVVSNLKELRYSDSKRARNSQFVRIHLPYARVLVVDDNVTNLDVARGMMQAYGMQIDCATSGQQAIDAIRSEKVRYNAIFMDHMMPGMDGLETAGSSVRKLEPNMPEQFP
jgi:signal transduction histidine kinase/PAS domain-containing protein